MVRVIRFAVVATKPRLNNRLCSIELERQKQRIRFCGFVVVLQIPSPRGDAEVAPPRGRDQPRPAKGADQLRIRQDELSLGQGPSGGDVTLSSFRLRPASAETTNSAAAWGCLGLLINMVLSSRCGQSRQRWCPWQSALTLIGWVYSRQEDVKTAKNGCGAIVLRLAFARPLVLQADVATG